MVAQQTNTTSKGISTGLNAKSLSAHPWQRVRGVAIPALSLSALVLLWIVAAALTADPSILPQPYDLIGAFWQEVRHGDLFYHMYRTLVRVVWAFCLAMSLGMVLGFAMGRIEWLNRWLDPWLVVFLNLPALVLIVLCYLWIGLSETAAIIAVALSKVPGVIVLIREGARSLSPELDALGSVFKMSFWTRLRHIILPQMAPFIAGAARNGLSVIWKIVLIVEFLGRSNGMGFQIHLYFQLFDVQMVLVYALSFITVMLVIEWGILQRWEARVRRWRTA